MKCSIILLFITLAISGVFAGRKLTLDPWEPEANIVITLPSTLPRVATATQTGAMLGGERDTIMIATNGPSGRTVVNSVSGNAWTVAFATATTGVVYMIYDGVDGNANVTNPNGLNCFDVTNGGAYAIQTRLLSDQPTSYVFTFIQHGTNGAVTSNFTQTVPGDSTLRTYLIPYSSFSPQINFACIGALQIEATGGFDVDSLCDLFITTGNDISGKIWRDCDNNGVFNPPSETAVQGFNVTLRDRFTRAFIKSVLTDSSGNYVISYHPGNYSVCAQTTPTETCIDTDLDTLQDITGIDFPLRVTTTITPPGPRTVDCAASTNPSNTGTATGAGCTVPVISFSDTEVVTCTGNKVITRLWTATAPAGTATATQTITVTDTTAPTFSGTFPANATLACGADTSTTARGTATATDNCSTATVTSSDATTGTTCSTTILRTWRAVDSCGNAITRNQTIILNDQVAPVFNFFPANVTQGCSADVSDPNNTGGVPTGTDACGSAVQTATFLDSRVTTACTVTMTRQWSLRDICGNTATRNQLITLTDATAPVFTDAAFPADRTVACGADTSPAALGRPTATDACGGTVTIANVDVSGGGVGCSSGIVRNWTATDACGNRAWRVQNIAIQDTGAPTFTGTFPANRSVECGASTSVASMGTPTASDSCTSISSITNADTTTGNTCTTTIRRDWTATDTCSNSVSRAQFITVVDSTRPTFTTFPNNATIQCDADTSTTALGVPVAADSCSTVQLPLQFTDSSTTSGCTTTIRRVWTASDVCDNTLNRTQVITVVDSVAPSFTFFPDNATVECTSDFSTSAFPRPTASDNCDASPRITSSDDTSGNLCPNGFTVLRTWTATDSCGNARSQVQRIDVVLTSDPTISVPRDLDIGCDDSTDPLFTGRATSVGNCNQNPSISFSDVLDASTCPAVLTRTWTVTDACSNSNSDVQIITITDDVAPAITAPRNITLKCDGDLDDLSVTGRPTTSDNCDANPTVTYVDTDVSTKSGEGICVPDVVLRRTFTVVDDCGNSASADQYLTIDNTPNDNCRPVGCRPVPCDPSGCPTGNCGTIPNCTPSNCLASDCLSCECNCQDVFCRARTCDEPIYIFVDDDDGLGERQFTQSDIQSSVLTSDGLIPQSLSKQTSAFTSVVDEFTSFFSSVSSGSSGSSGSSSSGSSGSSGSAGSSSGASILTANFFVLVVAFVIGLYL